MDILTLTAVVQPEQVLPFLLGAIFFVVPLVTVLTRHQQRMATILRGQGAQRVPNETDQRLLAELSALREMVAQQALTIDDLARSQHQLAERLDNDNVRERLQNS